MQNAKCAGRSTPRQFAFFIFQFSFFNIPAGRPPHHLPLPVKKLLLLCCASLLFGCTEETGGPRIGEPLDIKFTSLDHTQVDLTAFKGKVVLIDFWATWCGPCVAELPHVKAAYDKLHSKGFEIVGISFDQDEAALRDFTKARNMEWPQYFDGKGWKNDFGVKYGIQGIPTMWLVDKNGKLADLNGRDDLEGKVEKLLAK